MSTDLPPSSQVAIVHPMNEYEFKNFEEMINNLELEDRELIAFRIIESLPADSKARLFQKEMASTGLVVVMGGSNCSVNSDLCIQIQHAPNINVAEIIEAVVSRRQAQRGK